jgi:hypothetical protein
MERADHSGSGAQRLTHHRAAQRRAAPVFRKLSPIGEYAPYVAEDVEDRKLADESVARLTIYSETYSAQELADSLGVSPDESWNKGEPRRRGKVYQSTAISFQSHLPRDASPDEHLADLLTRIEPLHDRVMRQTEDGCSARLKVAFFADTDNPTLTFSTDVLRRVVDYGLCLELDIYDV